ncbi:baseplate J/gp47 family protein [Pandoraea pnomenusa]|uniref:baseplate J/gp47 family protein n=1 Tax=Pandoraea pnomenusa TaxID=93220 RepID=UPI00333E60D3
MPFQRKSLSTLMAEVAADISASLQGADALLRFAVLRVIGKIQAGMANMQMGYLDWIAKNAVPFTAEDEYLEGWAALKKVYRKAASAASLSAMFVGTPGRSVDAGTLVVRGDGAEYTTTATAAAGADGIITVTIVASVAGAAGNADPGTVVSLGVAVDGVQSNGTVAGTVATGADIELDDPLRSRMLDAYQSTPQGGDEDDYVGWARAVPGVTRAWCAPNGAGGGTVVVYTMFDVARASVNGFPAGNNGVSQYDKGPKGAPRATVATGDLLVVADSIASKQPVTALVWSCSAIPNALTFTISGLAPATTATRNALKAAIADVLYRNGNPLGGTINRSDIESSIAAISGTSGFLITLVQGVIGGTTTTYAGNITGSFGSLAVLNDVIFS